MTAQYLLDVNVLVALAYDDHSLHSRAKHWAIQVQSTDLAARPFLTCSIVELGFVRTASRISGLAPDIAAACVDLSRLRVSLELVVLEDSLHGNQLPDWVKRSDQTTDGHLLRLANHHRVRFATLDARIPGAEFIPYEKELPSEVREPAYARYNDMTTESRPDNSERYIASPWADVPSWIFDDPRWIRDPETGMPCVRGTPGARKITSEDVRECLKDFP